MKPPFSRNDREHGTFVSSQEMERLASPLTVLHAHIQLLQRRIRNGNIPDPESLLSTLAKLEQASRTLSGELRNINASISTDAPTRGKMDGNE